MSGPPDTITVQLPRSALTIVERPSWISQRTSEPSVGLPPRPYLELVRTYHDAGGEVIRVGKLRLVEVEPFVAWLRRRERTERTEAELDDVDRDALEMGLRVVGGRRR